MAKQVTEAVKAAINATQESAIVEGYCAAVAEHKGSGALVTRLCDTVSKAMKGKPLNEGDLIRIADGVHAKQPQWDDAEARRRKDEIRAALSHYAVLPEAVKLWKADPASKGNCDWHGAVALGRKLRTAKGNVAEAVAAYVKDKTKESATTTPEQRAAKALAKWYTEATEETQAKIREAAKLLGIKLNVKVTI